MSAYIELVLVCRIMIFDVYDANKNDVGVLE